MMKFDPLTLVVMLLITMFCFIIGGLFWGSSTGEQPPEMANAYYHLAVSSGGEGFNYSRYANRLQCDQAKAYVEWQGAEGVCIPLPRRDPLKEEKEHSDGGH